MDLINLIIALAICISVHEASHAWVAYKLGDPTAKLAGRVSLNPMRHLDLLGTLMIFLVHFGWGKPTPYNPNNLKHPRRDAALIALAGPISNFLTALILIVAIKYIPPHEFTFGTMEATYRLSIGLFLFNLIPIAPLDGSKFLALFVPPSGQEAYERFLTQGPFYLILIILGDRLLEEVAGFSILGSYLQHGYELITFGLFSGA